MPYKVFKINNKFAVYKTGPGGKRTGSPLGRHTSRAKANKQIAALAISEEKEMEKQAEYQVEDIAQESYPAYDLIDKSSVPYGAMTFSDVDAATEAEELMDRLEERTSQFYTLFWRIWNNEEIPVTDKVSAWQNLFSEFSKVFNAELAIEDAAMEELEQIEESFGGSIIRLSESDKQDGSARQPLKMDVVVIEPGWGNPKDNHYYPAATLRRDAARVFDGAKMYATDHRPEEKSVRTEVGKIEKIVRFSETGAPVARVKIWDADFAEDIRNREKMNELGTLEVSILAKGKSVPGKIDGRDANIVEAIIPSKYTNVDFVTNAGAGGRALQLVESEEVEIMPDEKDPVISEDVSEVEEVFLREGEAEEQASDDGQVEAETTETVTESEPTFLSEADVDSILSGSKLPDISKKRLASIPYLTESALSNAIIAEQEYIKTLIGSGEPRDLGNTQPVVKKLSEAELIEDHQKRIDAVIFG